MFPRLVATAVVVAAVVVVGCGGDDGSADPPLDPTPTKLDGTESHEFEDDDLERAAGASEEVQDYCAGAVSEAQRLGCLSHVDESDVP